MKLRYLFIAIASVILCAACEKEVPTSLGNIQLDKTYLSIPVGGGSVTLKVNATEAWSLSKDIQIGKDADGNPVYDVVPAWLTVSAAGGAAGESSITFTAEAIDGGREQEFHIECGTATQYFMIRQGSLTPVKATCAEVIAGAEGKNYVVSGVCTAIANTYYGNWYLNDGTGEVYIYGTFDADGKYNWADINIEVGDVVTVSGPMKNYNGTIELVDVSVLELTKSLLKIETTEYNVPKEGQELLVKAAYKGNGVFLSLPDEWVHLDDISYTPGVPTKIEQNPADTALIKLTIAPNNLSARSSGVVVTSANAKTSSEITLNIIQKGSEVTVSQVIEMADATPVTTFSSLVTAITTAGFVISDGAKAVYVYDKGANPVAIGDMVTVGGVKKTYNKVPEIEVVADNGGKVDVDSNGSEVSYPIDKDITDSALDYVAPDAEFISFSGVLAVSGKYFNITIDGVDPDVRQGSVTSPAEYLDAASWDGKKVTVTGYFNGMSGGDKYLNIIAVSIKEYSDVAPKGSVKNPYLASEICPLLADGEAFTDNVAVKGKISKIKYFFSADYGTATFWISDDGEFKDDNMQDFEAYSLYYFDNTSWQEGDKQIALGDEVILYGKVTYYEQYSQPETVSRQAWLYSLNGETE